MSSLLTPGTVTPSIAAVSLVLREVGMINERPARMFSLRFRKLKHAPELCIVVSQYISHQIESLLADQSLAEVDRVLKASEYLRRPYRYHSPAEPELALSHPDEATFGFDRAGYRVDSGSDVEYRFPLVADRVEQIALTFKLVLIMLGHLESTEEHQNRKSNSFQFLDIYTRTEYPAAGWGHMVTGYVYPAFKRWLMELDDKKRRAAEKAATTAIQSVWKALSDKDLRKYGSECCARISSDGRFTLVCFGNACDLSMYPETMNDDPDETANFSCHNLDSAPQQLSLLAGLAALHECAVTQIG